MTEGIISLPCFIFLENTVTTKYSIHSLFITCLSKCKLHETKEWLLLLLSPLVKDTVQCQSHNKMVNKYLLNEWIIFAFESHCTWNKPYPFLWSQAERGFLTCNQSCKWVLLLIYCDSDFWALLHFTKMAYPCGLDALLSVFFFFPQCALFIKVKKFPKGSKLQGQEPCHFILVISLDVHGRN